jgi:hypothetical protein
MSEELISAYGIRGTESTGLTIECAWNAGKALADWLPASGPVAVAYVPSQESIADAAIEGLRLQGRDVVNLGDRGKDFVLSYIVTNNLSGAIVVEFDELAKQITIEFYDEKAKLVEGKAGLQDICQLVEAGNFVPAALKGELLPVAEQ